MKNKLTAVLRFLTKWMLIVSGFLSLSYFFSLLSKVHGKDLPESYFSDGMPSILGLLNSELFMGIIFVITISIIVYVLYLLWQLHEVAVHRSQYMQSAHANLVFALSLCGLFIDKLWWVLAVIIAFTNWEALASALSRVIHTGIHGDKKQEQSS
ncbi:magnesium transporter [Vibrio mediterranei]|uniref:magnesium transporter n=1 Tax=Vibrio mediterranei TaxID=689 RepID=UPI001EFCCD8E|nr:magnesium transporter [Vibrio mediterranei]MCG9624408.1 magnesium transporter [Vibrio mediterranei]